MSKPNIKAYARDPLNFFEELRIPAADGNSRFADVMAPFQRDWFQAIAQSLLAVAAGKRPPIGKFWTERSKGASKDSDAACVLLWLLAFCPRKLDAQVGAADRDQAAELKKAAVDVLRLNKWLGQRIETQSWTLLCKATGSECNIIAADVAGSHGARPDIVILNELSHIGKEEFAANLLDNSTKKPNGLVIVATNAGFSGTWQSSWRAMAQESDRWNFQQVSEPAPWLSDEEVEEAERRNSRGRFARLFWGEWISSAGDALDQEDIQACIDSSLGPMGRQRDYFYVGGLDLGIAHDHSALVILAGRRDTQELRLAYAESWAPDPRSKKIDLMRVESTILEMHKRFNFHRVVYDPYQAALLAQRLDRQRVPMQEMTFVGKNLNEMASTLLEVFRSRRIRMYDHRKLIADLGRLSIQEKSYGYKLEATRDVDGHCDLATALAIALPLAVEESGHRRLSKIVGIFDPPENEYKSPFEQAIDQHTARANLYEHEMSELAEQGSDFFDTHGWQQTMRRAGRC